MQHLLAKNIKLILVWSFVFAFISMVVSMFFPKQYSATSQVLIISRDKDGTDPYTQARSAEKIGANLAQLINTTDFYDKVMSSPASFDRSPWSKLSDHKQRKKWSKDITASMLYGVSLMNVEVFSYTQAEAINLSKAVSQTLVSQGWEYLGGDVAIKMVSEPLVSKWPVRPSVPLNGAVGFLVGFLIFSLWVVRYKKHSLFGV